MSARPAAALAVPDLATRRRPRAWRRLVRGPLAILSLLVLAALLAAAVAGPVLAPYPEDSEGAIHPDVRLQPPSWEHPFGTDELGRDVWSRVLMGARISLMVGVIVLVIGVTLGTLLGAIAGFVGGRTGETIMRFTDIVITIPELILALAITAALGRSLPNTMLAIGLVRWPIYCRLVQAQVAGLKHEPFVEAAIAAGAGPSRVLFRQILPNCISPVIVRASLDMGLAILTDQSPGATSYSVLSGITARLLARPPGAERWPSN